VVGTGIVPFNDGPSFVRGTEGSADNFIIAVGLNGDDVDRCEANFATTLDLGFFANVSCLVVAEVFEMPSISISSFSLPLASPSPVLSVRIRNLGLLNIFPPLFELAALRFGVKMFLEPRKLRGDNIPLLDDNPALRLFEAGSSNVVDDFILAKELAVGANNLELLNELGPPDPDPDVGFGTI